MTLHSTVVLVEPGAEIVKQSQSLEISPEPQKTMLSYSGKHSEVKCILIGWYFLNYDKKYLTNETRAGAAKMNVMLPW